MSRKKIKSVDFIVVHCSATKEDQDIGVDQIRTWHLKKGWSDVGYHFIIKRDGEMERGRPHDEMGAHVRGFNHQSIGICLVGGVESDGRTPENNFTPYQWSKLEELVRDLANLYPDAEVLGHRDMPKVNKDCPCFDVPEWWAWVKGRGGPSPE